MPATSCFTDSAVSEEVRGVVLRFNFWSSIRVSAWWILEGVVGQAV